ncbi:MAG: hypothetical protein Q4G05_06010 [Clostridia bacterium]|nr:hypothetical protein [Clostridia bacterium]
MKKNNTLKNMILNKRFQLIALIIIPVIIISAYLLIQKYINKSVNNINESFQQNQYDNVQKYNTKLGLLKICLKNEKDIYQNIEYKVKYSSAILMFNNGFYDSALEELQQIQSKDETIINKIDDCNYKIGKQYLENENYEKALLYLEPLTNKYDTNDLLDTIYYNYTLNYLENKNYIAALQEIQKIKNKEYNDLKNIKKQIHYELGKDYFLKGNYSEAIIELTSCKDYQDSNSYYNIAYMAKAEELFKNDKYYEAKNIYDIIPEETEYKGIKAGDRKKSLNNISDILESIFNLEGIVYFSAFNDFSSLQEYCNSTIISKRIDIKNIKKIPTTFSIDENTKLLYSKGIFSIKYSKKDNYSTSFYNLYNSSVTY